MTRANYPTLTGGRRDQTESFSCLTALGGFEFGFYIFLTKNRTWAWSAQGITDLAELRGERSLMKVTLLHYGEHGDGPCSSDYIIDATSVEDAVREASKKFCAEQPDSSHWGLFGVKVNGKPVKNWSL
jgi:hypothetical protein